VPLKGVWSRTVTVGGVSKEGTFEVFDSNGAWSALFRKPLLKIFKAVHDYDLDMVKIPKGSNSVQLTNQHPQKGGTSLPKQCTNFKGDHCTTPSRQVSHHDNFIGELVDEAKTEQTEHKAKGLEEHVEQQPKKQETIQSQHPLTQEGNRRCTKEEHTKWQVANSLNEMKSQKDRTLAKHKRLGKSL
jgi:hypothetical protein